MQANADIGYFPTDVSLPTNLISQIQNLQQQLIEQIENGEIQVSPKQKLDDNISKFKNAKQDSLKKKLKKLDNAKQQLTKKLKEIEYQEKQIKPITNQMKSKDKKSKLQKSLLTQQDKQKIMQAKKNRKQFEQMLKSKINQIMVHIKQKQKQQQQQKAFQRSMKQKQRVVKLAQKRVLTEQSRTKQFDILKNSHKGIKRNNYSYIQNQLKDKKIEAQRRRYNEALLNQKKQKMKIDFQSIKKHSIQHEKTIAEHNECRVFQLKQEAMRKRSNTIIYQTSFTRKIKEQQRLQSIQNMRKLNLTRQARMKIMNFSDYIHENFRPKSNQKSKFVPKKQTEVLQKLTHQQVHEKGKQYLQIARKRRRKSSISTQKESSSKNKEIEALPTSSSQKYPNYLIDLHNKKSKNENVLQKMIKQKRLSIHKIGDVIQYMQKKQQGKKIGLNKDPLKKQFSLAYEKISLLNSMFDAEKNQSK